MLASIQELATARPHMGKSVNLSPADHRLYAAGYYAALGAALRVADLARERYTLATRTLRAERRRKKTA